MVTAINDFPVVFETVKNALTSGTDCQAMLALIAVAASILVPLTLFQPAWCYSVGYGSPVTAMSLAMTRSFDITKPRTAADLLVYAAFVYGIRLAAYLLVRTFSVKSMRDHQVKVTENKPRILWALGAVLLAACYACMMSPILFLLRSDDSSLESLQWTGVVVAYVGLALESIADQQKYQVKRRHLAPYGDKHFVGPTQGVYALCRHPNFLGEILFWTGLLLGGMYSFGNSMAQWLCGMRVRRVEKPSRSITHSILPIVIQLHILYVSLHVREVMPCDEKTN